MRTASFITLGVAFAALQACASTPGARPQDMSAAQHDRAAGAAEGQAVAWTSLSNPTKEQTEETEKPTRWPPTIVLSLRRFATRRAAAPVFRKATATSVPSTTEKTS